MANGAKRGTRKARSAATGLPNAECRPALVHTCRRVFVGVAKQGSVTRGGGRVSVCCRVCACCGVKFVRVTNRLGPRQARNHAVGGPLEWHPVFLWPQAAVQPSPARLVGSLVAETGNLFMNRSSMLLRPPWGRPGPALASPVQGYSVRHLGTEKVRAQNL